MLVRGVLADRHEALHRPVVQRLGEPGAFAAFRVDHLGEKSFAV